MTSSGASRSPPPSWLPGGGAAVSPCPSNFNNSRSWDHSKKATLTEVVTPPPDSASSSPSSELGPPDGVRGAGAEVASRLFDCRSVGCDENRTEGSRDVSTASVQASASAPDRTPNTRDPVGMKIHLVNTTEPIRKESLGSDELSDVCWDIPCSLHLEQHKTVLQRTVSRSGRQTQRWAEDTSTGRVYRVVTGTVPILSDGRIVVCSSSRKTEWILPKGGAETDETMELSAIRETYEEAGLIGVLGPRLAEVQYETRKGKKRRLEQEAALPFSAQNNDLALASTGGGSAVTCSHVRMTLFTMYVTEVRDEWPESNRARKVLGMDSAIEAMENRPEFREALLEVKRRGLHLAVDSCDHQR